MSAFWDITRFSLVEVYRRFRVIALTIEEVRISETSVYFDYITRRNIPESGHRHTRAVRT
jgi:hypothetical protein